MNKRVIFIKAVDWAFYEGNQPKSSKYEPITAFAGGVLIEETPTSIVFALEDFQDGDYRHVETIPKCCIQWYKIFDVVLEE